MEEVSHGWAERDILVAVIQALLRAWQVFISLFLFYLIGEFHWQWVSGECLPCAIFALDFCYHCALVHIGIETCSAPYFWPIVV